MDQDDPEKRIAELERQLAEPRAAGDRSTNRVSQRGAPPTGRSESTTGGRLTPKQVRNVAFSKPPLGKRGYNEDQVDAFLDIVEEQMKSQ